MLPVSVLLLPFLRFLRVLLQEHENQLETFTNNDDEVSEEIRLEWQEIARSEVSRHRRRLGLLSPEQQTAVESVLVHITNTMFEQLSMERAPRALRLKWLQTLRAGY